MSNIPVFLSSDNNYAPFVATTIASICDNTKSFIDFYIIDGGISTENINKIKYLNKKFKNFNLEFIKIDLDKYFKNFKETEKITKAMYSRFLIPYLKPEINKAIYTDVDVILFGDIKELYDEPLNNYWLGACFEEFWESSVNIERKKYLGLSDKHKYFNSGVLLLDCENWRKHNVLENLLKYSIKYKNVLQYPDQDVLNKYFDCNYKTIDKKYSYVDAWFEQDNNYNFMIRHYTADLKPWKINPEVNLNLKEYPHVQEFWKYAKYTKFYKELLDNALTKTEIERHLRHRKLFEAYNKIAERIKNKTSKY